jgi:hypothetical protein
MKILLPSTNRNALPMPVMPIRVCLVAPRPQLPAKRCASCA